MDSLETPYEVEMEIDFIECEICNKTIRGDTLYKIHITTAGHMKCRALRFYVAARIIQSATGKRAYFADTGKAAAKEDALVYQGRAVRNNVVPDFEDIMEYLQYLNLDEPIIGLNHLEEVKNSDPNDPQPGPRYNCRICDLEANLPNMVNHIIGRKHRQKYLEVKRPDMVTWNPATPFSSANSGKIIRAKAEVAERQNGRGTPKSAKKSLAKYVGSSNVSRVLPQQKNNVGQNSSRGQSQEFTDYPGDYPHHSGHPLDDPSMPPYHTDDRYMSADAESGAYPAIHDYHRDYQMHSEDMSRMSRGTSRDSREEMTYGATYHKEAPLYRKPSTGSDPLREFMDAERGRGPSAEAVESRKRAYPAHNPHGLTYAEDGPHSRAYHQPEGSELATTGGGVQGRTSIDYSHGKVPFDINSHLRQRPSPGDHHSNPRSDPQQRSYPGGDGQDASYSEEDPYQPLYPDANPQRRSLDREPNRPGNANGAGRREQSGQDAKRQRLAEPMEMGQWQEGPTDDPSFRRRGPPMPSRLPEGARAMSDIPEPFRRFLQGSSEGQMKDGKRRKKSRFSDATKEEVESANDRRSQAKYATIAQQRRKPKAAVPGKDCEKCGRKISWRDKHSICIYCLGYDHFNNALNDPDFCSACSKTEQNYASKRIKRLLKKQPGDPVLDLPLEKETWDDRSPSPDDHSRSVQRSRANKATVGQRRRRQGEPVPQKDCAQCGRKVSGRDRHSLCGYCLGYDHFNNAINDPNFCIACSSTKGRYLSGKMTRLLQIRQQDPVPDLPMEEETLDHCSPHRCDTTHSRDDHSSSFHVLPSTCKMPESQSQSRRRRRRAIADAGGASISSQSLQRECKTCKGLLAHEDEHDECLYCLGYSHAVEAVQNPERCPHCAVFSDFQKRSRLKRTHRLFQRAREAHADAGMVQNSKEDDDSEMSCGESSPMELMAPGQGTYGPPRPGQGPRTQDIHRPQRPGPYDQQGQHNTESYPRENPGSFSEKIPESGNVFDLMKNIEIEDSEDADFLKSKLCNLLKEFQAKKLEKSSQKNEDPAGMSAGYHRMSNDQRAPPPGQHDHNIREGPQSQWAPPPGQHDHNIGEGPQSQWAPPPGQHDHNIREGPQSQWASPPGQHDHNIREGPQSQWASPPGQHDQNIREGPQSQWAPPPGQHDRNIRGPPGQWAPPPGQHDRNFREAPQNRRFDNKRRQPQEARRPQRDRDERGQLQGDGSHGQRPSGQPQDGGSSRSRYEEVFGGAGQGQPPYAAVQEQPPLYPERFNEPRNPRHRPSGNRQYFDHLPPANAFHGGEQGYGSHRLPQHSSSLDKITSTLLELVARK